VIVFLLKQFALSVASITLLSVSMSSIWLTGTFEIPYQGFKYSFSVSPFKVDTGDGSTSTYKAEQNDSSTKGTGFTSDDGNKEIALRYGSSTGGLAFTAVGINAVLLLLVLVEECSYHEGKALHFMLYFLLGSMIVLVISAILNECGAAILYAIDEKLFFLEWGDGLYECIGGLAMVILEFLWYWLMHNLDDCRC